jgi:hypothetical protein
MSTQRTRARPSRIDHFPDRGRLGRFGVGFSVGCSSKSSCSISPMMFLGGSPKSRRSLFAAPSPACCFGRGRSAEVRPNSSASAAAESRCLRPTMAALARGWCAVPDLPPCPESATRSPPLGRTSSVERALPSAKAPTRLRARRSPDAPNAAQPWAPPLTTYTYVEKAPFAVATARRVPFSAHLGARGVLYSHARGDDAKAIPDPEADSGSPPRAWGRRRPFQRTGLAGTVHPHARGDDVVDHADRHARERFSRCTGGYVCRPQLGGDVGVCTRPPGRGEELCRASKIKAIRQGGDSVSGRDE